MSETDRSVPTITTGVRLQTRLMLLVLLVAGAALLAVDLVLPTALSRWLLQDKDTQLTQAATQFAARPGNELPATGVQSPIGLVIFDPTGTRAMLLTPAGSNPGAYPRLSGSVIPGLATLPGDSTHPKVRAVGFARPDGSFGYFWTPLADVAATVGRVIWLEIIASIAILITLALVTRRLLHRQLSPLLAVTATARANSAAGTRDRAALTPAAPEVVELTNAFNSMLDTVDASAAAQHRTETKLRRFITDASHELRTPLAAILGYGEMYQRGMITEPAAVSRAVDTIVAEADRMRDLVTAFMSLTDEQQARPSVLRHVDLGQVAEHAARQQLARSSAYRIEVDTDHAAIVLGDEERLLQAVNAVLDNVARHASGSQLTVINVTRSDRQVRITIDDDGPGVSSEALPNLFDRFYRTDPSRNRRTGGAGLGLAIVQAVAEAHQGSATAWPSPLGGLRIELTFPAAQA